MPRLFRIQINLPLLQDHLSQEDREDKPLAEVQEWLTAAGLMPTPDGWVVREPDLGQLLPAEVLMADPLMNGSAIVAAKALNARGNGKDPSS